MPRAVVFALVVLEALDATFVTLHVARDPATTGLLDVPRLSLAREFGYRGWASFSCRARWSPT